MLKGPTNMPAKGTYPAISLADAIGRIETLYRVEGQHPANRDVIAQALGYKSRNGASDSVIAALGYYDLIEDVGEGALKISPFALDIILGEQGDPERVNAIKRIAFLHPLFAELVSNYGSGQVSERNLTSYLVKRGFNQSTVKRIIRSYRETIDFVRRETEGYSNVSDPAIDKSQGNVKVTPQPASATGTNVSAAPVLSTSIWDFSYPLSQNLKVHVRFEGDGDVTQGSIDKLIRLLQLNMDAFPKSESLMS